MGVDFENPRRQIAILSIGDMGAGIARLLVAKGFRVITELTGRSAETVSRAESAGVESLPLSQIVTSASAILSIVPPADARSTAESVLAALSSSPREASLQPLVYVDLNAVSPASAKGIASLFSAVDLPHLVTFIDGAIIGGAPARSPSSAGGDEWSVPQIPLSGPTRLFDALSSALGAYHIGDEVGAASGLKMCFASLTKGYTAIATQAFTTAHRLGVLDHLQQAIDTTIPGVKARLEKGVTGMPPKAYRWVREMEEIGMTHRDEGGWEGADMFTGAAEIYRVVAGSVVGKEKVGGRKRGLTVEDVAGVLADELGAREGGGKRRKGDGVVEGRAEGDGHEEDKPNPMKRMWEEDKA